MATRILVINDDESILELFHMILEDEGYMVDSSVEALEDLQEVEKSKPDLIILDLKIGMQEQGWVMMQKLRMYGPTQHIPLILCTAALNEARQQEETLRDKGIPVLFKPFDIDELLQAVNGILPEEKQRKKKSGKKEAAN